MEHNNRNQQEINQDIIELQEELILDALEEYYDHDASIMSTLNLIVPATNEIIRHGGTIDGFLPIEFVSYIFNNDPSLLIQRYCNLIFGVIGKNTNGIFGWEDTLRTENKIDYYIRQISFLIPDYRQILIDFFRGSIARFRSMMDDANVIEGSRERIQHWILYLTRYISTYEADLEELEELENLEDPEDQFYGSMRGL